ncbi:hypothetical protein CH367_13585 [Leptospira barantonii]|uniref:Uncharacterized protein n=1 Tax=Leptospira barantonii TaxID=2023184 RepID=A0ABX4NI90_9LEPT|nr:hypothetical protein CH367_13585 [Leptospira barantonii]
MRVSRFSFFFRKFPKIKTLLSKDSLRSIVSFFYFLSSISFKKKLETNRIRVGSLLQTHFDSDKMNNGLQNVRLSF